MNLKWLDAKDADNLGNSLAQIIIERMPLLRGVSPNKVFGKQEAMLDKFHLQILQIKSNNKFNLYQKARLGNVFKSKLVNAGYDSDFINQLTLILLQNI